MEVARGVMISVSKKKEKKTQDCQPPEVVEKRPDVLECDVVRSKITKKNGWLLLGCSMDGPYENLHRFAGRRRRYRIAQECNKKDTLLRLLDKMECIVTISSLKTSVAIRRL